MTVSEAAKRYHEARTNAEAAAKTLKELKEVEANAEADLFGSFVDEGVNSVDLADVGKFIMTTKSYLSVKAENKALFYPYLKESGNGGLLREDVNPRTLSSFLREHTAELEKKNEAAGMDVVEARKTAIAFLESKGASWFVERGISFRKS